MRLNAAQKMKMLPSRLPAIVLVTPTLAQAVQGAATGSYPWAGLLAVAALVCFVTRTRSIGGWLLFFLFQVSAQAVYSVVTLAGVLQNSRSPGLHSRVLIFSGASAFCGVCLLAVSIILIVTRKRAWVHRICMLLAAVFVVRAILLLVKTTQFRGSSSSDILSLLFLGIYYSYFLRSARIRRVFVTGDWTKSTRQSGEQTPI